LAIPRSLSGLAGARSRFWSRLARDPRRGGASGSARGGTAARECRQSDGSDPYRDRERSTWEAAGSQAHEGHLDHKATSLHSPCPKAPGVEEAAPGKPGPAPERFSDGAERVELIPR